MNPWLSVSRVRAALQQLGMQPTRSFSQHFLLDASVLDASIDAAELTTADTVVEVGPGLGVLTWELVAHTGAVVAVELDKRLAHWLNTTFRAELPPEYREILTIRQDDMLRTDPASLVDAIPYKVVANLPYSITSPVLRHFLESTHPPERMVVLVQLEVAERIISKPGDMSMLAHSVQMYAEPEIVRRVPPSCFFPPPAVDSAVLSLRVRPEPLIPDPVERQRVFRVIKAGFLQTRKQLINALPAGLAALHARVDRQVVRAGLEKAGIAAERRAETLTLEEWRAINRALPLPGLMGASATEEIAGPA